MDGGGLTRPRPLTAELVARAIVAAARAYGDDPVRAMTGEAPIIRRALAPAAAGLVAAGLVREGRISKLLGLGESVMGNARRRASEPYLRAARAAEAALHAAASRAIRVPVEFDTPMIEPPVGATVVEFVEPGGCAPPVGVVRTAPPKPRRTITPVAARREVLRILAIEPCTAPELMEVLGLSEAQVRQALRELAEDRAVNHDALTAEGWRVQTWRLPEARA